MAVLQELDVLKPYKFHGVEVDWDGKSKHAVGTCPFCDTADKFSLVVDPKSPKQGLWRCLVCGTGSEKLGGNLKTFLRLLWQHSDKQTTGYTVLAKDRKVCYPETLMQWGVAKSIVTGHWLIPGYNVQGNIDQVYKYVKTAKGMRLLATPTVGHQLFGVYQSTKQYVFLCEGPWDAIVLWEALKGCRMGEHGIEPTANPNDSFLSEASVLAVPGCTTFLEEWLPLFAGKTVIVMFDNDHPKHNSKTNATMPPAGFTGLKRAIKLLTSTSRQPDVIKYLHWGDNGYDPEQPDGYDVRDVLTHEAKTFEDRLNNLNVLLDQCRLIPASWESKDVKKVEPEAQLIPCTSYKKLLMAWRRGVKLTAGLEYGLSVMLASVTSTTTVGDQLWVKIIGPPSCGKTMLCEGLSTNVKHVIAKSTIRGFHSGYVSDNKSEKGKDNSLIPLIRDKTLVTKDGDTLLQAPNLSQILSEARDVYDGTSRTHYRNTVSMDYNNIRTTWLLCGTSSLRSIDSSELGERFLDCVIMDAIKEDEEDEVLWRVVNKANKNMEIDTNGDTNQLHDTERMQAMLMTGGYIDYLRDNAAAKLAAVHNPKWALQKCGRLAKFIAYMRARPSAIQDEDAEREVSYRLASQLVRLARCLAVVMNLKSVNSTVIERVKQVALDTSRGQTLAIASHLYQVGVKGTEARAIALAISQTEEKSKALLRFLKQIRVAELYQEKSTGMSSKPRWRLTEGFYRLYTEVIETTSSS